MYKKFTFNLHARQYWIKSINSISGLIKKNDLPVKLVIGINLTGNINKSNFGPVHIVLLACFIEYLDRLNYDVEIEADDDDLLNFIFGDINLHKYFNKGKTVYVESSNKSILNLWQIIDCRTEEYSIEVTKYLQRTYFKGLDITGFKNSLDEIYANVADHSKSAGNAFSYIHYDESDKKIHFAVCDFGLGIAKTLRNAYPEFHTDTTALRESLEIGVSAKTNKHNRGFGLDNVVSNLLNKGMIRIVSNKALLFCMNDKSFIKVYPLDFDFKGTLIYFDISIDSFEKDEELENDVFL